MNRKRIFSALITLIMSSGIAIYTQIPNDSISSGSTQLDSLKMGKEVFENSCVRCHKLKDPTRFTKEEWPKLVGKMQKRAKITDEQKEMIIKYVVSEAKDT